MRIYLSTDMCKPYRIVDGVREIKSGGLNNDETASGEFSRLVSNNQDQIEWVLITNSFLTDTIPTFMVETLELTHLSAKVNIFILERATNTIGLYWAECVRECVSK